MIPYYDIIINMNPLKSRYTLINCFPRSGKEFLYVALNKYEFFTTFVVDDEEYVDKFAVLDKVSNPHILTNPDLYTISIVREPYDVITSLVYAKTVENGMMQTYRDQDMAFYANHYLEFSKAIESMAKKPNFIVVDFNKMVADPSVTCETIMDKFGMFSPKNFKFTPEELTESVRKHFEVQKQLDHYSGHMPRKKDALRNTIALMVKDSKDIIEPCVKAYKKIIKQAI